MPGAGRIFGGRSLFFPQNGSKFSFKSRFFYKKCRKLSICGKILSDFESYFFKALILFVYNSNYKHTKRIKNNNGAKKRKKIRKKAHKKKAAGHAA